MVNTLLQLLNKAKNREYLAFLKRFGSPLFRSKVIISDLFDVLNHANDLLITCVALPYFCSFFVRPGKTTPRRIVSFLSQ